jgi:hypothetical protein
LSDQIAVTSAELAAHWYAHEASEDEGRRASFFRRDDQRSPEDFGANGGKKFGGVGAVSAAGGSGCAQVHGAIRLPPRPDHQPGGYDGLLFVVDEFRSWQDRHPAGTVAYAEDEDPRNARLVLPAEGRKRPDPRRQSGDMPRETVGWRPRRPLHPPYLLADRTRTTSVRSWYLAAATSCRARDDVKDYYDYCRKVPLHRQGNVSLQYFTDIFPFQRAA